MALSDLLLREGVPSVLAKLLFSWMLRSLFERMLEANLYILFRLP